MFKNPWSSALPEVDLDVISQRPHVVGQGSYGTVYKVSPLPVELEKMQPIRGYAPLPAQVALKSFKTLCQRRRLAYMHRELAVFWALRHSPHVVRILGVTCPNNEKWNSILSEDDQKSNGFSAIFEWCPLNFDTLIHTMHSPSQRDKVGSTPQQFFSALRFLAMGLFSGLRDLHTLNIVHRDVKPANIMLTPAGVPRLGDFGMSRPMGIGDSGHFIAPRRPIHIVRRAMATAI